MCYYKTKADKDPIGIIILARDTVVIHSPTGAKGAFEIRTHARTFRLQANSIEDMEQWTKKLNEINVFYTGMHSAVFSFTARFDREQNFVVELQGRFFGEERWQEKQQGMAKKDVCFASRVRLCFRSSDIATVSCITTLRGQGHNTKKAKFHSTIQASQLKPKTASLVFSWSQRIVPLY